MRSRTSGVAPEVDAGDRGLAGRRREERREHAQGRGLAGPVGPEEAEDLAGADVQVDAAHGLDPVLRDLNVWRRSVVSIIGPLVGRACGIVGSLCRMLLGGALAPFSIFVQYLHRADNYQSRSVVKWNVTDPR